MSNIGPYGREDEIFQYINQMERNLLDGLGSIFGPFRSEFSDGGDRFILKIALPGFRKEDIELTVQDGQLTVEAGRPVPPDREPRDYDRFFRTFTLTGVQSDRIVAGYRDGLLTIELPKIRPEDSPPGRRISIQ